MTSKRQILSYDEIEDKDIDDWLDTLPKHQKSKHIRLALRTYIHYLIDQKHQKAFLSHLTDKIKNQEEYLRFLQEQTTSITQNLQQLNDSITKQKKGLYTILEEDITNIDIVKAPLRQPIFTVHADLDSDNMKSYLSKAAQINEQENEKFQNHNPIKEEKQVKIDINYLDSNILNDLGK